jgi:hypothetical protein
LSGRFKLEKKTKRKRKRKRTYFRARQCHLDINKKNNIFVDASGE